MMNRLQRMNAMREALVLAVVLVSLAAAALWVAREPADEDELRLSASTPHSQEADFAGARRSAPDTGTGAGPRVDAEN